MNQFIKVGAAALFVVFAAGCTDLKPLQAQIDDLKTQVSALPGGIAKAQASADAAKAAADSAARAAQAAQTAAQAAQSRADAAMAAAQANKECCDRPTRRSIACSRSRSRSKDLFRWLGDVSGVPTRRRGLTAKTPRPPVPGFFYAPKKPDCANRRRARGSPSQLATKPSVATATGTP